MAEFSARVELGSSRGTIVGGDSTAAEVETGHTGGEN